jgi:hypothetical protein
MDYKSKTTTEVEFEGNKIAIEVSRLSRKDMVHLMPFLPQPDDTGEVKVDLIEGTELADKIADILPPYVTIIGGITLDGELPTFEQLANDAYFINLVASVSTVVFQFSFPGNDSEKKSELELTEASEESQEVMNA